MELGVRAATRYAELGLADALARHYDYPRACEELSLILRLAYSKLPKSLQSLIFHDTLSAFRLLPQVKTRNGIASANLLVQAADASLPKQKKSLAVSEFKRAMVAYKRRGKARQEGGSVQLPPEILVHIFSFLDMQALMNVSSVCWEWNSAAADSTLWRLQYSLLFGDYDIKSKVEAYKFSLNKKEIARRQPGEGEYATANPDWREVFKRKYIGLSWKFASHRAICGNCKTIVWLSHLTSDRQHDCSMLKGQRLKMMPILLYKVVDYLLGETDLDSSDSDDSDSDDSSFLTHQLSRLWAYPKLASSKEYTS